VSAGIERLAVYVPGHALDVATLAAARGVPAGPWTEGLGIETVAVPAPCEDAVTLGATALLRLAERERIDGPDVGLLVAVTGAPLAGSMATHLHALAGLDARTRMVDVRGRGRAVLAALQFAAEWVRAARAFRRRALVVAADVVAPRPGADEPLQGAAGVAVLVGPDPLALQLGDETGTWTASGDDPDAAAAIAGALRAYRPAERPEPTGDEVVSDRLAQVCWDLPAPAAIRRAHRHLVLTDWEDNARRWAAVEPKRDAAADAAVDEQVAPTLTVPAHVGDVGAAHLLLVLAGLFEGQGRRLGGRRIGLAVVDGRTVELATGLVPAKVGEVSALGLDAALQARALLDVAGYEAMVRAAGQGGSAPPGFTGAVTTTIAGGQRHYHRVA
jgi:3-hydroxy-3-methylglutaryl CoA synthase